MSWHPIQPLWSPVLASPPAGVTCHQAEDQDCLKWTHTRCFDVNIWWAIANQLVHDNVDFDDDPPLHTF